MNDTTPEEWRPIAGYEGIYEVSNLGRVRSLHSGTARVLQLRTNRKGYKRANLALNGKVSTKNVHILVIETFVGPRPAGYECRHLDSNPGNNELANLKWGSHVENMGDMLAAGNHHEARKTHCPRGHKLEAPNILASQVKNGKRLCLACRRARSYVRYHKGETLDLQTESDRHYANILNEVVK